MLKKQAVAQRGGGEAGGGQLAQVKGVTAQRPSWAGGGKARASATEPNT